MILNRFGTTAAQSVSYPLLLGNPFTIGTYAKNVWDMQLFDGFIYLGSGNSSNNAPDVNAGPIPVIRYNPSSNIFEQEFIVDEEQIDVYKIINGNLYIPGHDATEDGSYGNFYERKLGFWTKHRNVPSAIHVFDLIMYNDRMYAGCGSSSDPRKLVYTTNEINWVDSGPSSWLNEGGRVYSLFVMNDKLYAFAPGNRDASYYNNYVQVDGDTVSGPTSYTFANMYPGVTVLKVRIARANMIGNTLLYICGQVYNDQQFVPLGLYKCTTIGTSTKITLPNANALPVDILVRDNTMYLLTYVKNGNYDYTIIVYGGTDVDTWVEILRFDYETFMRSFEEIDGDFYFGTGCYTDVIPSSIGNILLIRKGGY